MLDTLKCVIITERGAFLMPRTNKKYTPELKIQVVETRINEHLTYSEAAQQFEIFIHVNGYQYPNHHIVQKWERIYLEEGKDGFYLERRGRGHKTTKNGTSFTPKVEEDLLAKCQRLEMENEYLKKLSALVSAR